MQFQFRLESEDMYVIFLFFFPLKPGASYRNCQRLSAPLLYNNSVFSLKVLNCFFIFIINVLFVNKFNYWLFQYNEKH